MVLILRGYGTINLNEQSNKIGFIFNEFPAFMKNKLHNCSRSFFLFFCVVSGIFVSCSNSSEHHIDDAGKSDNRTVVFRKPSSSFSDTITIDFPAAVFYNADSLQLEKIKAITDTMVFESIIHDCFYQMRYSHKVLQQNWSQIKIVEIRDVRYIFFKSANGRNEYIDLNTKNEPCGIIIFKDGKKAQLVDMPNIDSQLGFYFSN